MRCLSPSWDRASPSRFTAVRGSSCSSTRATAEARAFALRPGSPALTVRRHLVRTALNVVEGVHNSVSEEWSDIAGVGPNKPSVAAVGDAVTIRFFGTSGEPLPAVQVR